MGNDWLVLGGLGLAAWLLLKPKDESPADSPSAPVLPSGSGGVGQSIIPDTSANPDGMKGAPGRGGGLGEIGPQPQDPVLPSIHIKAEPGDPDYQYGVGNNVGPPNPSQEQLQAAFNSVRSRQGASGPPAPNWDQQIAAQRVKFKAQAAARKSKQPKLPTIHIAAEPGDPDYQYGVGNNIGPPAPAR